MGITGLDVVNRARLRCVSALAGFAVALTLVRFATAQQQRPGTHQPR